MQWSWREKEEESSKKKYFGRNKMEETNGHTPMVIIPTLTEPSRCRAEANFMGGKSGTRGAL